MKYNKQNNKNMFNALAEYENSKLSYDEVCNKYGINKPSFCYYLNKSRIKNKTLTNMSGGINTIIDGECNKIVNSNSN